MFNFYLFRGNGIAKSGLRDSVSLPRFSISWSGLIYLVAKRQYLVVRTQLSRGHALVTRGQDLVISWPRVSIWWSGLSYLVATLQYLVVRTQLSCGHALVSRGQDLAMSWPRVSISCPRLGQTKATRSINISACPFHASVKYSFNMKYLILSMFSF